MMPGVTGVAVHARPDPLKENGIVLMVRGPVTVGEVKRWCEQQLSAYKQPNEIEIAG